jgi:hypothetical protein
MVALWLVVNTLVNRPVESVTGLALIALGLPVYWYFHLTKPVRASRAVTEFQGRP